MADVVMETIATHVMIKNSVMITSNVTMMTGTIMTGTIMTGGVDNRVDVTAFLSTTSITSATSKTIATGRDPSVGI